MSQTKDDGFTVGDTTHPLVDSRDLPAVTPEQEEQFLSQATVPSDHPDDEPGDNSAPDVEPEAPAHDNGGDEQQISDADLSALLADVDTDAVHPGDATDQSNGAQD